jgi:hypothetical protein
MMSRLNWSYLVNTAITGTRKMPHFARQFIKVCLDVPFLSGQTSPKCFKSSNGRSLAIETQYLKRNPCECAVTLRKGTNHIACNLIPNFFSCDFRRTNSCTVFSSSSQPASKPRESWKT